MAIAAVMWLAACGGARNPAVPEETPAPIPTPNPIPHANLAPASQGCGLPPGGGTGNCPYGVATFVEPIDKAIAQVQREHPEYFDFSRCFSTLSCQVVNPNAYLDAMVVNLRKMHLCAIFDGEEIAIKNTNGFSDQYHVFTSQGNSRWGIGAYRATCEPAWF